MWDFVKKLFGFKTDGSEPLEERTAPALNTEEIWPFPTGPRPTATNNDVTVEPTEKTIVKNRTSADKRKKRKFVKREDAPKAVTAAVPPTKKSTKAKK